MKKFARLLSMVLAVATVLTLCVGAFDYVDAADIDESKVKAVNAVYDWGIMQGNNKGEFNPKGLLTRDEMSKIMYAMKEVGLDVESYYGGFLTAAFVDAAKVPAWRKHLRRQREEGNQCAGQPVLRPGDDRSPARAGC